MSRNLDPKAFRAVATVALSMVALTTSATPPSADDMSLPIVKVAPGYPERAIKEGIEGHVLLEFVVTETGAVRDAAVLEAEPRGVFERAALKAVTKFKYKPRMVDGKPVETPGVRHRIVFEISDSGDGKTSTETRARPGVDVEGDMSLPIVKVAPVYPERAIKEGIEGHVLLEFVVTDTGAVRDATVLDAEPSGVFEQAALNAVAKFKYKPRIVDGKPVETSGVRNRVAFEISDQ